MEHIEFIDEEFQIKPAQLNSHIQKNSIQHLQFIEEKQNVKTSNQPTSSFENLISQNEDLMARLKVTLRRLSVLEIENSRITEASQKIQNQFNIYQDQNQIYKEKENSWVKKIKELEHKNESLSESIKNFQNKHNSDQIEINRFKKYQEKIKKIVKPFLTQLKLDNSDLKSRVQESELKLVQKEQLISQLRNQINDLAKLSQEQIEIYHKKFTDSIQHYENQIVKLSDELQSQLELNRNFENKLFRHNEIADQLIVTENKLIAMARSKENLIKTYELKYSEMQIKLKDLSSEYEHLKIRNTDMLEKITYDENQMNLLKKENKDVRSQIENLRYMWNAKNQENENLKLSLTSLEALNVQLSQKISEKNKI